MWYELLEAMVQLNKQTRLTEIVAVPQLERTLKQYEL
jgi:hypothetical protein